MGVRRLARSVQGSRRAGLGTVGRSVVLMTRQAPQTRYSLMNGCYGLRSPTGGTPIAGAEGPFRMQASSTQGFTITNLATGTKLPVAFVAASGCAIYPEADVDATGTPFAGASPEANVLGTVEGHAHVTAFELFGGDWHCGRPWSPFGAPAALPASCAPEEQGTNGALET